MFLFYLCLFRDFEESGVVQDPYEVLGVKKSATQEEIKKAYRKVSRSFSDTFL